MLNFRVDKNFNFGRSTIVPVMEIFNLTNTNTVLAQQRNQAGSIANQVSGIVAPAVIRFGVQVRF
jgi:hypothetical protein